MNLYLIIAAALALMMGLAHSFFGERFFLKSLFKRRGDPDFGTDIFINRTTRIAWHLTTISWLSVSAILMVLASAGSNELVPTLGLIIVGCFGISGLFSLIGSHGRHLSWIVFFLIALMVWLGI